MKYRVLALGLSDEMFDYFRVQFLRLGAELVMALNVLDATRLFNGQQFHLVVAALGNLHGISREDMLAGLRRASYVPIVVLTDNRTEAEAQRLTDLGVDLCLSSDEPPGTLFSLAAAQLRRYTHYNHYDEPTGAEAAPFHAGDIFIDPPRRHVEVRGRPVALRPREFTLLLYFMQNPGIVLTTEQICEHAWGNEAAYGQGVSSPIAILRKAIEPDPKRPVYIETLKGVGYRFIPRKQT